MLYFAGDRITPYTSQARIQAFVVPVAAEVAGKVLKVHIRNNDEVQPGQPLFDIDPKPFEIALQTSPCRLRVHASLGQCRGRGCRGGARLAAGGGGATARWPKRDASRQERLYKEDSGAISVRRLEIAQSTRDEARSKVHRAEADLRKAQETAGEAASNAQLQSARSAVEKAELDLTRTKVLAPARGTVTDLRTDVGHFAQPGAPVMTLIAMHDLWISADMTENNLGNIRPGDKAAIVLDIRAR